MRGQIKPIRTVMILCYCIACKNTALVSAAGFHFAEAGLWLAIDIYTKKIENRLRLFSPFISQNF